MYLDCVISRNSKLSQKLGTNSHWIAGLLRWTRCAQHAQYLASAGGKPTCWLRNLKMLSDPEPLSNIPQKSEDLNKLGGQSACNRVPHYSYSTWHCKQVLEQENTVINHGPPQIFATSTNPKTEVNLRTRRPHQINHMFDFAGSRRLQRTAQLAPSYLKVAAAADAAEQRFLLSGHFHNKGKTCN